MATSCAEKNHDQHVHITISRCVVANFANKTNKQINGVIFIKPTRIGAVLVTCGIWIFSGTCPVLKKLLLLIIYWMLSSSLNFSTLRDLHKWSRK